MRPANSALNRHLQEQENEEIWTKTSWMVGEDPGKTDYHLRRKERPGQNLREPPGCKGQAEGRRQQQEKEKTGRSGTVRSRCQKQQ